MPKDFTDQMGRTISLAQAPKKIISIVPSQTELLFDLGLDENIVGLTWFCIHPAHHFNATEKVGGTKKLNFDKIRALQPDLIIGNKEENDKSQIEELEKEFPVWMSDINTLDDALLMIKMLGDLTNTGEKAHQICGDIILLMGFRSFLIVRYTPPARHISFGVNLIWEQAAIPLLMK